MGLVGSVHPSSTIFEEALSLARKIATMPVMTVAMAKRCVLNSLNVGETLAWEFERSCSTSLYHSYDTREGVAAFKEKRRPVFKNQ